MNKTLLLGYGNADRQDDGVAWHILVAIAKKLGFKPPEEPGEPFNTQRYNLDLMFVLQLLPELAEDLRTYDHVVFIDAHTGEIEKEISALKIDPLYQHSPFTHHLSPQTLLSITQTIYNKYPQGIILSVRGYEFGFERQLSRRTLDLCNQAVSQLWNWLQDDTYVFAHDD